MAVPGVLMRMVEAPNGDTPTGAALSPSAPCPNIEKTYILKADDEESPSTNTVYFLSDISPIVSSSEAYDKDVSANGSSLASIAWVVCSFINGRDRSSTGGSSDSSHVLSASPAIGSVVVVNGSTPRADKEQDYHDWYDQEHGEKLTLVPGWNTARRYALKKAYGDIETANFYGFNFYDAENGLGGPEWKAGVTEWTMRIRSNAAKPNIRRVWKVVSA